MRAHGGDIALAESTGAGTVFLLKLPASSAELIPTAAGRVNA
jgi:signal transduction histidine kinase